RPAQPGGALGSEPASPIYQVLQRGEEIHADEVLVRADGSRFPAEYWALPIRRSGEIIGAVVSFIDITERRHAEARLWEQAALLAEQAAQKPDVLPRGRGQLILVVDDECSICELTRATLEMNGYRALTASDGAEAVAALLEHRGEVK